MKLFYMNDIEQQLIALFSQTFGHMPGVVLALEAHASDRKIFRLTSDKISVIGVVNDGLEENRAFIEFSKSFKNCGLPVPEIYAHDLAKGIYLEQDLGNTTLLSFLMELRKQHGPTAFPTEVEALYTKVVQLLPRIQVEGGRAVDYSLCHPIREYGPTSMYGDMNYFRDSFLVPAKIEFDPTALKQDFKVVVDFLDQAPRKHFMYRDFQARNVMIFKGEPYFIDYQGGRLGALQYDLASILTQVRADIPVDARDRLLQEYLDALDHYQPVERAEFLIHYRGFVMIRLMQVLATYGNQGWTQGKEYFRENVPMAMRTLQQLLDQGIPIRVPQLLNIFESLISRFGRG